MFSAEDFITFWAWMINSPHQLNKMSRNHGRLGATIMFTVTTATIITEKMIR